MKVANTVVVRWFPMLATGILTSNSIYPKPSSHFRIFRNTIKAPWVTFIKPIDTSDYATRYNHDKNVFSVCLVCGHLNFQIFCQPSGRVTNL